MPRYAALLALTMVLPGCSGSDDGGNDDAGATSATAGGADADSVAPADAVVGGDYRCLVLEQGFPTPAYAPSNLIGFRFGPANAFTHLATGGASGTYALDRGSMQVTLRGAGFDGWVAEYGFLSKDPAKPFLRFRPKTFADPGPELRVDDVMCYGGVGP